MLWYKLKTWYNGEEELVKEIRRTVPPYLYKDVFVINNERNLRRRQQSIIEQELLFRGCVFITCDETEPLFRRLDKIPAISRLIAAGYLSMFPLMEQDARFLEAISGPDHIVRASHLLRESEDSSFYRVYGPLEYLADGILKIRFSSRFAKTHHMLWGEDTVIPLGVMLNADMEGEILYRGLESISRPLAQNHYTLLEIGKDGTGKNTYRVCKTVTLIRQGEDAGKADRAGKQEEVRATV